MELASWEPHPGTSEKRTGAPEETAAVRRDEHGPRPPL